MKDVMAWTWTIQQNRDIIWWKVELCIVDVGFKGYIYL